MERTKTEIRLITSIRSKIENRWIKTVHLSSEKGKVPFSLHHGRECNSVGKKEGLGSSKDDEEKIQEKKGRRSWQRREEKYSETSASQDENSPT